MSNLLTFIWFEKLAAIQSSNISVISKNVMHSVIISLLHKHKSETISDVHIIQFSAYCSVTDDLNLSHDYVWVTNFHTPN